MILDLLASVTFFWNFFTKLLAERMGLILPKILSPQEGAFTKGREISDNINLAHEIVKGIDKKNRGGNVVFKLDMEKAYDKLECDFLNSMLSKFGFNSHFICLVNGVLYIQRFSLLVIAH